MKVEKSLEAFFHTLRYQKLEQKLEQGKALNIFAYHRQMKTRGRADLGMLYILQTI